MMKRTILILIASLTVWTTFSQTRITSEGISATDSETRKIRNYLNDYQLVELNIEQLNSAVKGFKETDIIWNISGEKELTFTLSQNEIRSPDFVSYEISEKDTIVKKRGETLTYKGYLPNGEYVRLAIDNGFVYGGYEENGRLVYIKQLRDLINDKSVSEDKLVLYTEEDVIDSGGTCGTPEPKDQKSIDTQMQNRNNSPGCHIVELQLHADPEFRGAFNVYAQILAEINLIQPVYENDLDVVLSVTSTVIFHSGGYTSNTSTGIINEIKAQWNNISTPKDLIHLFTGKNPGNFGRASGIGDACNNSKPVCYSRQRADMHQTVAHEIGHLLNGRHGDGQNCGLPNQRTIMCQGEDKMLSFSAASINRITNFMDNENCFNFNTTNISGPSTFCSNTNTTYSLANYDDTNGTNITWSLNSTIATIISGQGTDRITLRGNSSGQATLTATIDYPGTCGSVVETKTIKVGPYITLNVQTPDPYGYAYATITGGSAPYNWTIYGANGTSTQTTSTASANLYVGCTGGYLQVQSSTPCGGTANASSQVSPCSGGGYYSSVFPNPTSGKIHVKRLDEAKIDKESRILFQQGTTLRLYDFTGYLIRKTNFNEPKGELIMDVSDLRKGNYILQIVLDGQIEETHQIIIE